MFKNCCILFQKTVLYFRGLRRDGLSPGTFFLSIPALKRQMKKYAGVFPEKSDSGLTFREGGCLLVLFIFGHNH